MSLPTVKDVRERIENVKEERIRMFLKAVYVFAARPAELAGEPCSGETLKIGPFGNDAWTDKTDPPNPRIEQVLNILDKLKSEPLKIEEVKGELSSEVPVAVFQLNVAKASTEEGEDLRARLVALPLAEKYEPWTKELLSYFHDNRRKDRVFPFNRQVVWHYITNVEHTFKGMFYFTQTKKGLPRRRKFGMNALRVVRATELIEEYSFDLYDLREFIGLNLDVDALPVRFEQPKTFYQDWRRYIKKLCKE